jgi:hypothetical protein
MLLKAEAKQTMRNLFYTSVSMYHIYWTSRSPESRHKILCIHEIINYSYVGDVILFALLLYCPYPVYLPF